MRNPFQIIWEKIHTPKEKYVPPYPQNKDVVLSGQIAPIYMQSGLGNPPVHVWPQVKDYDEKAMAEHAEACDKAQSLASGDVGGWEKLTDLYNKVGFYPCPTCGKFIMKGGMCGPCYCNKPGKRCSSCGGWFNLDKFVGDSCGYCLRVKNGYDNVYWDGFKFTLKEKCTKCNEWYKVNELKDGICECCRIIPSKEEKICPICGRLMMNGTCGIVHDVPTCGVVCSGRGYGYVASGQIGSWSWNPLGESTPVKKDGGFVHPNKKGGPFDSKQSEERT